MFLTFFLLFAFVSVNFSSSNYFIDNITILSDSRYIAYPVNKCVTTYVGYPEATYPYAMYNCSNDGSTVTVNHYLANDPECTGTVSISGTYNMTDVVSGVQYSFECNGMDNYVTTGIYLSNACVNVVKTTNFATDVCFIVNNVYQMYTCTATGTTSAAYGENSCTTAVQAYSYNTSCTVVPDISTYTIYQATESCYVNNTNIITTLPPTAVPSLNPATAVPSIDGTYSPTANPSINLVNTSYFIDSFDTQTTATTSISENKAYPVNICVPQGLTFSPTYAIYRCNADGNEVAIEKYDAGDSECTGTMVSSVIYNNSNVVAGEQYSFECKGDDNYLTTAIYINTCNADVRITVYTAVGICYQISSGYQKLYCSSSIVYESTSANDDCSSSDATTGYSYSCEELTVISGYTIYSETNGCFINNANVLPTAHPSIYPTTSPTLDLSDTTFFIDRFYQDSSTFENTAYPVNICVPQGTASYAIYRCNVDGDEVTVEEYAADDSDCSQAIISNMTYDNSSYANVGEQYSFECNGVANYLVADIYYNNACTADVLLTVYTAVGICYEIADGFQKEYCSSTVGYKSTDANDSDCYSSTTITSELSYSCEAILALGSAIIYSEIKGCYINNENVLLTISPTVHPSMNPSFITDMPSGIPTGNPITGSPTTLHETYSPTEIPTTAPTVDLSNTNYFFDTFTAQTGISSTTSYITAYPVNICVSQELQLTSTIAYAIYRCNTAGDEVTVEQYEGGDDDCSGSMTTTTYSNTYTAGEQYSFECNGENNYLAIDLYLSCSKDAFVTLYVVAGVCHAFINGGYSKWYCSKSIIYQNYFDNDPTCTSNATVSDFSTECQTIYDDAIKVYSKIGVCMLNDVNVLLPTESPSMEPTNVPTVNPTELTNIPTSNPSTFTPSGGNEKSGSSGKELSTTIFIGVIAGSVVLFIGAFLLVGYYFYQKRTQQKGYFGTGALPQTKQIEFAMKNTKGKTLASLTPEYNGEIDSLQGL